MENQKNMFSRKELRQIAWRSFFLQLSFNFSRMQGLGFLYIVIPALRKIYKDDKEGFCQAMMRHTDFINTHPMVSAPITAMVIAMEEKKEDPETIRAFKVSTMGPVAGIGDAMYNFMYDPVMRGIVASLAYSGAWIAIPLAFLVQNIVKLLMFKPLYFVYEAGATALIKIQAKMRQINRLATTIGLMSLGGLAAAYINVQFALSFNLNDQPFSVQTDIFDKLMPNVVSLIILLSAFYLVRVKKWNIQLLIWSMIGLCLVGSYFGILS
ncbi:MAG: PTS system mannose/fructose/sorbose family transporter subunit IID [Spirochaetia bacterium]